MGARRESDSERLSHSIGLVYDAIGQADRWPQAMAGLMPSIGAHACHLLAWNFKRKQIAFQAHTGFPAEAVALYDDRYVHLSPLRHFGERAGVGQVLRCHELFDDAFVAQSEYYNEYRLPISGRATRSRRCSSGRANTSRAWPSTAQKACDRSDPGRPDSSSSGSLT